MGWSDRYSGNKFANKVLSSAMHFRPSNIMDPSRNKPSIELSVVLPRSKVNFGSSGANFRGFDVEAAHQLVSYQRTSEHNYTPNVEIAILGPEQIRPLIEEFDV